MPRRTPAPGRGRRAVLLATLGVLALTACARPVDATPAAPADVHPRWSGCAATGAFGDQEARWAGPAGRGPVPDDFAPAVAVLCDTESRTRADGARVRVGVERRAAEIGALLTYLAQPSKLAEHPEEQVCPAMAVEPAWLFLLDAAGRWVTPSVPTDACGFPLGTFGDARPAYAALDYRDGPVQELQVEESAEARRSGCSQQHKDLLQIEAERARPARIDADPFADGEIRVCLYRLRADEQTDRVPVGDLVRGRQLDRGERRALHAALVDAPPAPAGCARSAERFAVLHATERDRMLHLELDGCRRVLDGGADGGTWSLARADRHLVRLLSTATR